MELYWLLRLPVLHTMFCIVAVLFGILTITFWFGAKTAEEDGDEQAGMFFKRAKNLLSIFIISLLIVIFTPDSTQLAVMLGYDAIKSDSVQEVIDILKTKLK